MNPFAWKPIPEGTIVLDFSRCKNADDFHSVIKEGFGFPNYYGRNWDALWDCLRDFAMSEKKRRTVLITGTEMLSEEMAEYLHEATEIFEELEEKYPNIHFSIEK